MNKLVEIYTGEGKGKTTAAAGLVLRTVSHHGRAAWVSFHKSRRLNFDLAGLDLLGVNVFVFASSHPGFDPKVNREDLSQECRSGIRFCREKLFPAGYDLIVLDEVIISARDGFVKEEEVIALIKDKPLEAELVLTGRGATEEMKNSADLVTEMKEIKHPFRHGEKARPGIEY